MNRKVTAVLVCTFLALVAATVWVPYCIEIEWWPNGEITQHRDWRLIWSPDTNATPLLPTPKSQDRWPVFGRIDWPILFAEHALIVLLGGGLLTWVVRRGRRRAAAS